MANIEESDFRGSVSGDDAVKQFLEYTTVRTRELEKTRRLLLGATVILVVLAAVISVFAPLGREKVAYAISVVLVVLALGSVGAARFQVKLPGGIDVGADRSLDPMGPKKRGRGPRPPGTATAE